MPAPAPDLQDLSWSILGCELYIRSPVAQISLKCMPSAEKLERAWRCDGVGVDAHSHVAAHQSTDEVFFGPPGLGLGS